MSHDAEKQKEQNRVDMVVQEINIKEEKLFSKADGLKESIVDLRKNFWEDVTVNLDEPDDVIETQASLKQQAELLAERERSHGSIDKERKTLRLLKESPYFGRIDFLKSQEVKRRKYISASLPSWIEMMKSSLFTIGVPLFLVYIMISHLVQLIMRQWMKRLKGKYR